jgi:hypothetical protein
LPPNIEPNVAPPPIPPILLIIILLIYMLRMMNIPNIATKEIGNGTSMEIVMLIPKDIPIQTN